ncbi:MAG: hypothetical protein ACE5E4_13355, partial [Candidatus Binatia bacterium]
VAAAIPRGGVASRDLTPFDPFTPFFGYLGKNGIAMRAVVPRSRAWSESHPDSHGGNGMSFIGFTPMSFVSAITMSRMLLLPQTAVTALAPSRWSKPGSGGAHLTGRQELYICTTWARPL